MLSPAVRNALILATLLAGSSLTIMSGTTIAPALPALAAHFRAVPDSAFLTQLALTIPGLFIVIASPIAGYTIDKIGPKPVLLSAVVIYIIAGSSGLFLNDLHSILVGRAVLGLSVAGIMTSCVSLIGAIYLGPRRNAVLGYQTASMAFGGVVFVAAGGILAQMGWRLPFLIYAMPVILLPTMIGLLPHTKPRDAAARADGAGDGPIPWRLLGLVYAGALFSMITFYTIAVGLPFHLAGLGHPDPLDAGVALGVNNLAAATIAILYRRIRVFISQRMAAALTFLFLGAGLISCSFATSYTQILFAMILSGGGMAMLFPSMVGLVLRDTPERVRGRASGGLTMSIFLGQFTSPLVMAAAFPGGSTAEVFAGAGVAALIVGTGIVLVVLSRKVTA